MKNVVSCCTVPFRRGRSSVHESLIWKSKDAASHGPLQSPTQVSTTPIILTTLARDIEFSVAKSIDAMTFASLNVQSQTCCCAMHIETSLSRTRKQWWNRGAGSDNPQNEVFRLIAVTKPNQYHRLLTNYTYPCAYSTIFNPAHNSAESVTGVPRQTTNIFKQRISSTDWMCDTDGLISTTNICACSLCSNAARHIEFWLKIHLFVISSQRHTASPPSFWSFFVLGYKRLDRILDSYVLCQSTTAQRYVQFFQPLILFLNLLSQIRLVSEVLYCDRRCQMQIVEVNNPWNSHIISTEKTSALVQASQRHAYSSELYLGPCESSMRVQVQGGTVFSPIFSLLLAIRVQYLGTGWKELFQANPVWQ